MPRRPPRPECGRDLQRTSSQLTSPLIFAVPSVFGFLRFRAVIRVGPRPSLEALFGHGPTSCVGSPGNSPPEPGRQHISPADYEALLNDTDAVADKPVEAQARRNVQR